MSLMPRREHLFVIGSITADMIQSGSITHYFLEVNGRLIEAKPPWEPIVHELMDSMEDTSKRYGRPLRNSSRETIDQLRLALAN